MDTSIVLGCSGTRRVGKDTLFTHLHTLDSRWVRKAFADQLKADVAPLIRDQFGYDPDNLTPEQKEVCRHVYIGYGMAWRAIDSLHWVKVVADQIDQLPMSQPVALVDCRFSNEVAFFRERYGAAFKHVDITRISSPAPTDEEEKHYRTVAAMADRHLAWGDDTEAEQLEQARILLEWCGLSLTPAREASSLHAN